jgi:hypothetical protein
MSEVDIFPYTDRENAFIIVRTLADPYGEGTDPVVSVACSLKGDIENPTWKVHIPMDILEDLAVSLYKRSPIVRAENILSDADERHVDHIVCERLNAELRAVQNLVDERSDES